MFKRKYYKSSESLKTIVTVTGIRPDFIRMKEVFLKLDNTFNHILIHSGQHYDEMLSDIFFQELNIRRPDYNLGVGKDGGEHFHQLANISVKLIEVLRNDKINPDLIIFLGDSNSALVAAPLKKEGYRIGHIEAGMRSHDKRMLEEINRTVCDICSDFLFVYHDDYAKQLYNENIKNGVYVVGNTIVEICNQFKEEIYQRPKTKDFILVDIHRPENFKYKQRLKNIIKFAKQCGRETDLPIKMLNFKRTLSCIKSFEIDLSDIEVVDLMSYKNYLKFQYDSLFMISDSGTAQEEPALLDTPVIVPRDFTERLQSVKANCSIMLNANDLNNADECLRWATNDKKMDISWLGDGETSENIIKILKNNL